jgi:hypothetical protein
VNAVQLRRTLVGLVALCACSLSTAAWAGDCAAPYTSDKLLEDLPNGEQALRNPNGAAAFESAKKMQSSIPCLNEVLPPMILARAYRLIGAGLFLGKDTEGSKRWFSTAYTIDRQFAYGIEDFPSNSPVPNAYQAVVDAGIASPTKVENKILAPGTHYLDGQKLKEPKAVPAEPHLYQWDNSGTVKTWLIDGAAFPDEALAAAVAVADPNAPPAKPEKPGKTLKPKEEKPAKPEKTASNPPEDKPGKTLKPADEKPAKPEKTAKTEDKPGKSLKPASSNNGTTSTIAKRVRPPEKTPLMIAGPAVILGSGALYYIASQQREAFNDAKNQSDMDKYRANTNRLVIVSAAVFAVGTGMLTWGIIVDDGAALPAVRVQF